MLRYTSSKGGSAVYACLLMWSSNTTEVVLGAPKTSASTVVTLLGSNVGPLAWKAAGPSGGIIIDVSNIKAYSLASDWAWVFKLENISEVKPKQQSKQYRR